MPYRGRYIYTPAAGRKIGRRLTLIERIRRWRLLRRQETPDVYMVTGYCQPVYPRR